VRVENVVLEAQDLEKTYVPKGSLGLRKAGVPAVRGVSLQVHAGETVALVGESGCGKSTTARMVARLTDVTRGRIVYDGVDVTDLRHAKMRPHRRTVQMVFQDSWSALDPRMTCAELIAEPLRVQGAWRKESPQLVDELLDRVGLAALYADRRPETLSGGQRQRLCIARALALHPKVLLLDEPVSALDASIQAQILGVFQDLQRDLGIAYLFISHDLAVVRHLADRVLVMNAGLVLEEGPADAVFQNPQHEYTRALLAAVPASHPSRRHRTGQLAS